MLELKEGEIKFEKNEEMISKIGVINVSVFFDFIGERSVESGRF